MIYTQVYRVESTIIDCLKQFVERFIEDLDGEISENCPPYISARGVVRGSKRLEIFDRLLRCALVKRGVSKTKYPNIFIHILHFLYINIPVLCCIILINQLYFLSFILNQPTSAYSQ